MIYLASSSVNLSFGKTTDWTIGVMTLVTVVDISLFMMIH